MKGFFVLILCFVTALRADVCKGLPPATSSGNSFPAGSIPNAFHLTVKPGGPSFRITIQSLHLNPPENSPVVHAGEIEVARCLDGKRLQVLDIRTQQSIDFANSFHAEDVNFDGYLDFAVTAEFAGSWGSDWWWIYDADTGRFVQNELTRDLRSLKSAEFNFDPKKHEIGTRQLSEPWGCGRTGDRYRVADGRLLIVHKELAKPVEGACRVIVSDRIDGVMRVTKVRRFVDGNPLP
jgi:hypothetical protein